MERSSVDFYHWMTYRYICRMYKKSIYTHTFSIERKDHIKSDYSCFDLLQKSLISKIYILMLSSRKYISTCNYIMSCGTKMRTLKRENNMYLFGSSMGATDKAPKFILSLSPKNIYSMLPRPIVTSKPKQKGSMLLNETWLIDLVNNIANIVIHHLKYNLKNNYRNMEI